MKFSYSRIRNLMSIKLGHLLLDFRRDDVFIASYPRSGNTWLRTILVNILASDKEFTPELRAALIPDMSIRNVLYLRKLASPRLIKTHSWYQKKFTRVVYLARDGRDVLVSFYHYLITRNNKSESFSEFFDKYMNGYYGQRWHENVESWIVRGRTNLGPRILIVKFEDLKKDTFNTTKLVTNFIGIKTNSETIENAIQQSSIEQMRDIESQRKGNLSDVNQSFYRGGRSGEWKEYLTGQQQQQFLDISGYALELLGYI